MLSLLLCVQWSNFLGTVQFYLKIHVAAIVSLHTVQMYVTEAESVRWRDKSNAHSVIKFLKWTLNEHFETLREKSLKIANEASQGETAIVVTGRKVRNFLEQDFHSVDDRSTEKLRGVQRTSWLLWCAFCTLHAQQVPWKALSKSKAKHTQSLYRKQLCARYEL